MSRGSMVLSLIVLFMLFFTSYVWVRAQEPQMLIAHSKAFGGLQRPAVKFDHEKHSDMYPDCVQCHHDYEYKDGKRINAWDGEGKPCSECHKIQKERKTVSLRVAFHDTCMGCNTTLSKEGKKTGPETCGECHVRGN
jgi:hypothetical protein